MEVGNLVRYGLASNGTMLYESDPVSNLDFRRFKKMSKEEQLKKLRELADEMEASMVKSLLVKMKRASEWSEKPSLARRFWEEELFGKWAEVIAKSGDLGISEAIYNQLKEAIEGKGLKGKVVEKIDVVDEIDKEKTLTSPKLDLSKFRLRAP